MDNYWSEYDKAAKYYAKFGRLPDLISPKVAELINEDTEAFYARARAFAYAIAMGDK